MQNYLNISWFYDISTLVGLFNVKVYLFMEAIIHLLNLWTMGRI